MGLDIAKGETSFWQKGRTVKSFSKKVFSISSMPKRLGVAFFSHRISKDHRLESKSFIFLPKIEAAECAFPDSLASQPCTSAN